MTPTQVFSCEYYEIFKSTYFEEHLWTTASNIHLIQDPGSPIIANKLNKTDAGMLKPLVFTVTKRLHFPKSLDVSYVKQQTWVNTERKRIHRC